MPMDVGRVQKEIRDIERDRASGVTIEVQGNSLQKMIGCLKGAPLLLVMWGKAVAAARLAALDVAKRIHMCAVLAPCLCLARLPTAVRLYAASLMSSRRANQPAHPKCLQDRRIPHLRAVRFT